MSWVAPNTTIKLYNNVPLDNSYEDTIYFANLDAQATYFHSTITPKYTFPKNSYQRVRNGVMRVQVLADNVYDCNYMAFKNINHGNKWFYAFITGVEYIGETVTEITYELDLMQTYFFDVELGECFIERETQQIDIIGNNIKPEPVSLGEYVFTDYDMITPTQGSFNNYDAIIGITDVNQQAVDGLMYDNLYSGNTLYKFPLGDNATYKTNIDTFLEGYVQRPDAVNFMYAVPTVLTSGLTTSNNKITSTTHTNSQDVVMGEMITDDREWDSLSHYVPKNKKLYTYPYSYLHVDNGCGQALALRYEFFKRNTRNCIGRLEGTFLQPVEITLRPLGYKGMFQSTGGLKPSQPLMTETISLTSFPQCSWNTDAYKAWLAQNSVPIALDVAGLMANTVADTYMPYHKPTKAGPSIQSQRLSREVGVSHDIINQTTEILKANYTASIQADICRGRIDVGNSNCSTKRQAFYSAWCHITEQMARTIDDFFTKYGYTCHYIKKPARCVRTHWTYTKTVGCIVKGKAPADDLSNIRAIYDSGITFWRFPTEVGNYSLDNSEPVFNMN